MIHVAYRLWGGDGYFAKLCGTSMLSIFENTKEEVTVHIMHNDRLTPDNRGKFCYIAGKYNQRVEFHNVEEIAGSTLRKFEAAYPISSGINASWYPLISHEIFPNLDKIIIIGTDTVINLDIAELWAYDPNQNGGGFGAVVEKKSPKERFPLCMNNLAKHENYFNADVLLVNPKFFRENFDTILDGCKFIYQNNYTFCEQDVLNYLFQEKYLKLPYKFNEIVSDIYRVDLPPYCCERAIYHFAGANSKPDFNIANVFNRMYFEYFLKTPWANVDMFGNINKSLEKNFGKFLNESHSNLLNLAKLLTRRRRAFIVDENSREVARQIFEITPDESIVSLAEGSETLVRKMNDLKGEVIFFVLPNNYFHYGQIRNFLLKQKFIEGVDFVNGFMFLSERQGINLHFEIKAFIDEINKDM